MLRLATRILSNKAKAITQVHDQHSDEFMQNEYTHIGNCIASGIPVFNADNVAKFYAEHDQVWWDNEKDFPSCVPVAGCIFIEHVVPDKWNCKEGVFIEKGDLMQEGVLLTTIDAYKSPAEAAIYVSQYPSDAPQRDARWFVWCRFVRFCEGHVFLIGLQCLVAISPTGSMIGGALKFSFDGQPTGNYEKLCELISCSGIHVAFLAMSFANCKNVVHRDSTREDSPPDKWLRRQKQPRIVFKTLEINPMREILKTEGGIEHNGIRKALHICRGHFATYTPERPLFGRISGTVWKPAHKRGDIKSGAVIKDYTIKTPDLVT